MSDGVQVVIFVWDASPLRPLPGDVGEDAETGRGLLIVQAVSAQWGWDFPGVSKPALLHRIEWHADGSALVTLIGYCWVLCGDGIHAAVAANRYRASKTRISPAVASR